LKASLCQIMLKRKVYTIYPIKLHDKRIHLMKNDLAKVVVRNVFNFFFYNNNDNSNDNKNSQFLLELHAFEM
jgi:hypothetical protein